MTKDPPATKKIKTIQAAQQPGDDLWKKEWVPSHGEATIAQRSRENPECHFRLYNSFFCPFGQRSWIVAEEVGVDYQWIEINPYHVDETREGGYTKKALPLEEKARLYPDFVKVSPRGLVPGLQHENVMLWESLPVAEYIDAQFGSGQLAGTTPYEKARIQVWTAHITERVVRQFAKALMAQDMKVREQANKEFFKESRTLAKAMSDEGPYFLGTRFSLVDVALAPFWQRAISVGNHYMNLDFPQDPEFERLRQWWNACKERASVKRTFVCEARLISTYLDYSLGTATSDSSKNYK